MNNTNASLSGSGYDRRWVLMGKMTPTDSSRMVVIEPFPFLVGRRPDVSLTLPRQTISGIHAEIVQSDAGLFIRDLNSTNGTYVNGKRITEDTRLEHGALIQFADIPFQVGLEQLGPDTSTKCQDVCDHAFALVQFQTLIANSAVVPFYQPIINLQTGELLAFEVLMRSRLTGLETPAAMFRAAEELGMQIPLSQLACQKGLEASWTMGQAPHLFLNTHPDELATEGFPQWLEHLRDIAPLQPLTIEIHEAAITDIAALAVLRKQLDDLNIGLAFDDFGAGQARIAELAEIRPDHLKFDRRIITRLDQADTSRKRFVQSLIHAVQDLGILALAEGIETEGEFEVCKDMGFETAQGFYFGRPESVEALRSQQHLAKMPVSVK